MMNQLIRVEAELDFAVHSAVSASQAATAAKALLIDLRSRPHDSNGILGSEIPKENTNLSLTLRVQIERDHKSVSISSLSNRSPG